MSGRLEFETRVDLSGLNAGSDEAKRKIVSDSEAMAQAQARLKLETKALADAMKAFGVSAAEGNKEAVKAIAEHMRAAEQARAAVQALGSAQKHTTESIAAASGAFLELEGRTPRRAFERFLATTLQLGPALQAAFPAVGMIAFGEVAFDVGKKLYDAFDLGGQRAREVANDIRATNNEMERTITNLDVQIDKLEIERAKLEHKPVNGLKLAIDEAAEAAQHLDDKLQTIIKDEVKAIEGMSASTLQSAVLGGSKTGYEVTMLQEHSKWLSLAKSNQDQLNESKSYASSLQTRLNELLEKQNQEMENLRNATAAGGFYTATNYQNEINAVQTLIGEQKKEQEGIQKTIDLDKVRTDVQKLKDAKTNSGESDKASRALLASFERELNDRKLYHSMTLKEEYDFWDAYKNASGLAIAQQDQIIAKMVSLAERGASQAHSAIEKFKNEQEALTKGSPNINTNPFGGTTAQIDQLNATLAAGELQQKKMAAAMDEAKVAASSSWGTITSLGSAQAIAAIHAREFADQLAALNKQMTELQSHPDLNNVVQANKVAALQNQINQVRNQANVASIGDQNNISLQIARPFTNGFDVINREWLQMQNKLIFGTKNVSQAFANMGVSLLESVAASFEKMLVKQVAMEFAQIAAHRSAQTAITADTAIGTAQRSSIVGAANLKEITSNAAKAASAAYGAMAGIPIVGPALGAVAAGATFAAVEAFGALAAFETGGIIPNTGVALVHQGEAVIPAALTNLLLNAAGSTTNNNSNASQVNNFNGSISDRQFLAMSRKHAGSMFSDMKRAGRNQGRW